MTFVYIICIVILVCERVDTFWFKNPVQLWWKGWVDSDEVTSGVGIYYFEVHKLVAKDATFKLTEDNPIKPLMTDSVMHVGGSTNQIQHNKTFTPSEPGMYRYDGIIYCRFVSAVCCSFSLIVTPKLYYGCL